MSRQWIAAELTDGYEADASDCPDGADGKRRVYLQYIAGTDRSGGKILSGSSGYLGAFSFTVQKAFAADEGVKLTWEDYALGAYTDSGHSVNSVAERNRAKLLQHEAFQQPEDVLTAASAVEGVTVSGQVQSYNPKNPVELALYTWNEGTGSYESEPAYETTIAALDSGSGQVTQAFAFEGVAPGTYQLVAHKSVHLVYTINNLSVEEADIDLTTWSEPFAALIDMLCGDVDGDGAIDLIDQGILLSSSNYNKDINGTDAPETPKTDLDGDNMIDLIDQGIMLSSVHYNKSKEDVTFTISQS